MIRVGQRLQQERTKRGITLDEVAKATKIRFSFLSAIEKGEYKKLPSMAYAQGFVKNYAQYLGLPMKETIALFRREFNEKENFAVLPQGLTQKEEFSLRRIKLSQTLVLAAISSIVIVGYFLFQYRYIILNPPLTIRFPKEGQVVSSQVVVWGETDPNASVYVNDLLTSIDENGKFQKTISLFPGKEVIKVRVRNRLGNETSQQRTVIVE